MNKKTVAVFFGSRSAEHDVSIITALSSVIKPLELTGKYSVVPVYIAKDGSWYSDEKLKDVHFFSSGKIDEFLKTAKRVHLGFENGLTLVKPGFRTGKVKIDIAFPATHGTNGEDGALMGVLQMANIPFVGCEVAASAIAMDKVLSKQVATANGIPTPKSIAFTKHEFTSDTKSIVKNIEDSLQFPLFVKPAHLGSSIGITRVSSKTELQNAIEVALHYDDKAIVEEGVNNLIEVTVPIMGNNELQVALVEQPLLNAGEFFDFNTKYMNQGKNGGGKKSSGQQGAQGYSKLPADITPELYEQSVSIAKDVYRAVGCSGIARIDLLIDSKEEKVYFNEINPLPGSLYAHNWRAAGVPTVQLVDKLVTFAEERHKHKQELASVFQSSFLRQF